MEIVQGGLLETSPYSENSENYPNLYERKGVSVHDIPFGRIQKKNENCPSPANQRDRIFRE